MSSGERQPGELYWRMVEPIWHSISIYDGPDDFIQQFRAVRPEAGHLFAAHWCQSEVRNGGLHQFFSNSTGVLAPEALEGFRAIGLRKWASILKEAMRFFGTLYPRDRVERLERLPTGAEDKREEWDPFCHLDEQFYEWLHAEDDRWERLADAYAKRCSP
jgi:hypothetical protein